MSFENQTPNNESENLKKPEAMIIDGEEMLLTPEEAEMIKRMRAENSDSWREQA
ncbi:MAG: hypothetical protein NUV42_00665 [Candidatus Yonathbacteria bacterium]|nr:hypothetical protein [Candidatus Yonathbacteria bacterium]